VYGTIHDAAAAGNVEDVRNHLLKGEKIDSEDRDSRTALHIAAEAGQVAVAVLLLTRSPLRWPPLAIADVNAAHCGQTPLHLAAKNGHIGMVKLLLDHGAIVNARTKEWFEGSFPTLKWYGRYTPLYYAASRGHLEVVELLISRGADVNLKDYEGFTALHYAQLHGYANVVAFLRQKGASE